MAHIETAPHHPLIDLAGLSLRELDALSDNTITESLREVLDPALGESAAAGFDSSLKPPEAAFTR